MQNPTLEETFAGCLGRWRVVDRFAPAERRFAVMMLPLGAPDGSQFEVELCAVQYRPHADAIAALPELACALGIAEGAIEKAIPGNKAALARKREALDVIGAARLKAERADEMETAE